MCSGRIDLEFILRAFANGQDGVFIGACRLNECNYVTQGNFDAFGNVFLCRKILKHIGLNPERIRIEFMSAADGNILAEGINDFVGKVKELGPLGEGEEIDADALRFKLDAVRKLIPYLKLVERERMRVPLKTREAYERFFTGDEFNGLFDELVVDKLAVSQIMLLLREKPLSTQQMAEALDLNPSEISGYMNSSSRHGLVRYDEGSKCYTLAGV
jgi:coenzyme F420-reducing hydrogenase delta subunit